MLLLAKQQLDNDNDVNAIADVIHSPNDHTITLSSVDVGQSVLLSAFPPYEGPSILLLLPKR